MVFKYYKMTITLALPDDIDPNDDYWSNHLAETLTECPGIEGWIVDTDKAVKTETPEE